MHLDINKGVTNEPQINRCYTSKIQSDSVVSLDTKVYFLIVTFPIAVVTETWEKNRLKELLVFIRNVVISISRGRTIKTPTLLFFFPNQDLLPKSCRLWTRNCLTNCDPLWPTQLTDLRNLLFISSNISLNYCLRNY